MIWRGNWHRAFSFQTSRIRAEQKLRSRPDFLRAWCAVAYAFSGLHPDGFEDTGSGWPRVLKRFAAEAWRRADAGELADEELYPCDAQWSGLYDRMHTHENDETARRFQIAADHGERADG